MRMKSIPALLFFWFINITAFPQVNDDIAAQVKTIVAAAETNFSMLRSGNGQKIGTYLQFPSTLSINGTDTHTISVSQKGTSATYIIPVNSTLNKEQIKKLYQTWNKSIGAALGTAFEKSITPINMGALAEGEQSDYVNIKNPTITVTIANVYNADTKSSSLDVYVRNEKL